MIELKEIIDIYKNTANIAILHDMTGYKQKYIECSCGFKNHIENKNSISYCPSCGCNVYKISNFSFNKIKLSYNRIEGESFNEKDLYRFGMVFIDENVEFKLNFSKKTFKNFKILRNACYLVFFDGYERDPDKIIRYINLNTEEEITKKEFLEGTNNICSGSIILKGILSEYKFLRESFLYCGYNSANNIMSKILSLAKDFKLNPYYEILIKAGIDPYNIKEKFNINLNEKGKTPSEILGIKKYSLNKLKSDKYKTNYTSLKLIEEKFGSKLVQYHDLFVNNWGDNALKCDIIEKIFYITKKTGITLKKFYDYIENCYVKQYLYDDSESSLVSIYYDSLVMSEQLDKVFNKTPKSLVKYHDVLSKESELMRDKIKSEKIAIKMKEYSHLENISLVNEEGKFKDKYSIILPKSVEDIVEEGKKMHHCVGTYVDRILRGTSLVLFLRKSDNIKGRSIATFEVNPFYKNIVQIKAPYNQKPEKEAIEFIRKWSKKHKISMDRNY